MLVLVRRGRLPVRLLSCGACLTHTYSTETNDWLTRPSLFATHCRFKVNRVFVRRNWFASHMVVYSPRRTTSSFIPRWTPQAFGLKLSDQTTAKMEACAPTVSFGVLIADVLSAFLSSTLLSSSAIAPPAGAAAYRVWLTGEEYFFKLLGCDAGWNC